MSIKVFLVISCIFAVMLAVNLEVPLYQTYAHTSGYGAGSTAFVFSAYLLGLLPTMFFLGGISDRIGRRETLIVALSFAIMATLVMMISATMSALWLARILQGVGAGLSLGAGTAYLLELTDKPHHVPLYTGFATTLGIGSGALMTNLALFYRNTNIPVSYWTTVSITLLCLFFVPFLPETKKILTSKISRLPYFPSDTVIYSATIMVAWSVTGVIIALLPFILENRHLGAWTGTMVFLAISTGVLVQPLARRLSPFHSIKAGIVLVSLSFLFLFVGAWHGMISVVLIGAALGGISSFGFSYIGGLSAVIRASRNEISRAVSGYFLSAYLGLGVPTILVGSLGKVFGLYSSLFAYGIFLVIFNSVLWIGINSIER